MPMYLQLETSVQWALQFLLVLLIAGLGALLTGKPLKHFIIVFPVVYIITLVALVLAGNSQIKNLNLEAVIFSLSLGLLIGNLFKLPDWFRATLATELYVKIGLVLLGTSIIFSDVLKAGSLGLAAGTRCCGFLSGISLSGFAES